jgi:hypothetical protein
MHFSTTAAYKICILNMFKQFICSCFHSKYSHRYGEIGPYEILISCALLHVAVMNDNLSHLSGHAGKHKLHIILNHKALLEKNTPID